MGIFSFLSGRKKPPAPTSTTRVTVSPDGFRLEGHYAVAEDAACDWDSVSGAFRSPYTMKGINVCTVEPPYLEWVPDDAEGVDDLLAELERRELLGPEERITTAWEAALSELLAGVAARRFDAAGRDEAERLLEPFRPRVALAVLELGGGSLEELRKVAGWAREDARDALHAAWQAKKSQQPR